MADRNLLSITQALVEKTLKTKYQNICIKLKNHLYRVTEKDYAVEHKKQDVLPNKIILEFLCKK